MVDVLIQTHNEEINLSHALQSVTGWAHKIFVIDSGSTDGTLEIARRFGAEVVHHDWEGYAGQKNWAIANIPWGSEWILILDADESVTPELRSEIDGIVDQPIERVRSSG
jgi:glycosyltransferase involved in cell wall biosynthesis